MIRQSGRGAARVLLAPGRYVYGAWSRRAGGPSLGVDLTPDGECSVSCVYCQVPREGPKRGRPDVDLALLRTELQRAVECAPAPGWADLVFAGSGEPTLARNFCEAVREIADVLDSASFSAPRRVYTNGLHLSSADVVQGLSTWSLSGGEIWVKLDAVDDAGIERVWRVRLPAEQHLQRIWAFARNRAIGIQASMLRGGGLPPIDQAADRLASTLAEAIRSGANLIGVHLVGPSRPPGDPEAARDFVPATAPELEAAARVVRAATGLSVSVFP